MMVIWGSSSRPHSDIHVGHRYAVRKTRWLGKRSRDGRNRRNPAAAHKREARRMLRAHAGVPLYMTLNIMPDWAELAGPKIGPTN